MKKSNKKSKSKKLIYKTNNEQKKIIFLIRAYNDIDHSTPLIYYLSKDFNVEVYSKIPLNYILPNDNIEYLLSRNIKSR